MNLLDTCTIIYALDANSPFNAWATQAIIDANASGAFVNPIIVAELASGAQDPDLIPDDLLNFGLQSADLPMDTAIRAGKAHSEYLARLKAEGKQGPKTPLPDFFIGAHAENQGWTIITNDPNRFKTYFPRVNVQTP
jgi:predicted nucleic acid-binding protein